MASNGKGFWGPPIWACIHEFALMVTDQNRNLYITFLWLLTALLPCDKCKGNLVAKLQHMPPGKYVTGNPLEAFNYSYHIHDQANRQISHEQNIQKVSPLLATVKNAYLNGISVGPDFWGPSMWTMLYIFAATLKDVNAIHFKSFLNVVIGMLPEAQRKPLAKFVIAYPIDPHLRTNHDAFFYIYKLHNTSKIGQIKEQIGQPYIAIKTFYFSKLGEECEGCRV